MSKKQDFIKFINDNVDFSNATDDVKDFWKIYSTSSSETEKPEITENGIKILSYMRENDVTYGKARDIAEGMGVPSRTVSGSLRKLCNDGFIEKLSDNPAIYSLTTKGNEYKIN